MKPMTRAELAASSPEGWRDWLRDGLRAFHMGGSVARRIRAFEPLVVSPTHDHPAAELAWQIEDLLGGRTSSAAQGAAAALESWWLATDGASGAAMGVEVAAQLGAPRLAAACIRLARQAKELPSEPGQWLVWTLVRAAAARFTREDVDALGRAISDADAWTTPLLAEYAAVLASDGLEDLPGRLIEANPRILAEPHTGEAARAIGRRVALNHERKRLETAFLRKDDGDQDVARLRWVLATETSLARTSDAPSVTPGLLPGAALLTDRLDIGVSRIEELVAAQFEAARSDMARLHERGTRH